MVLITTDLMHHSTFSTCICCGGYSEQRLTSLQLYVLLPNSFGSSCPSFCYKAQRICYLNNFSLTVEEERNIYKIKEVCPAWSKFKPFQNHFHSLQISPSQLPSSLGLLYTVTKACILTPLDFQSAYPRFCTAFYMKSKFILPSQYSKNTLPTPSLGAGHFTRRKGGMKPAFHPTPYGTCGVWINGENTAASNVTQVLKSS